MKISVIVPTYQERDNIKPLIKKIANTMQGRNYEIVVVDDNSPDGTAEVAAELSKSYPVKVVKRERKLGLASAVTEGFRVTDGTIIGVIDADLQHPPELIRKLVEKIEHGCDIASASRYVEGGGVKSWSLSRRIVSRGATLLARPLTKVKDPLSGYFFIRRRVIEKIRFSPAGFKILLEILVKGDYERYEEVPYTFSAREMGRSKLRADEYVKYLELLCHLYPHKCKKARTSLNLTE
jgi:dolichol-phosphate mannosyltransferase